MGIEFYDYEVMWWPNSISSKVLNIMYFSDSGKEQNCYFRFLN